MPPHKPGSQWHSFARCRGEPEYRRPDLSGSAASVSCQWSLDDDRGRLHEASAIRAVVETGRWRQAVAAAAPVAGPLAAVPGSAGASLAEAVDRADPPLAANADPEMPSHEAVAAARAKLDPIAAIKADVATRVATRPSRQRSRGSSAPTRAAAPSARPVARPPAGPEAQQLTAREASPPTARPVVRASNFPAAVTEER